MATPVPSKKQVAQDYRHHVWVVIVLLVVLYLVGSSEWCFKSMILPRASQAMGATITVEHASIHPFSAVSLSGLKMQPASGSEQPLLTAKSAVARYGLMAILGGHIKVDELSLTDPVIWVKVNPDGTSNLDALKQNKAPSKPAQEGKPPRVDIGKVVIQNGHVTYLEQQHDGSQSSTELSDLNFTANNIKNGQTANCDLQSKLTIQSGAGTNRAEMAAVVKGAFRGVLGADLMPTQIKGDAGLTVSKATGSFADAAQLDTKLAVEMGVGDIKECALNFTKAGNTLGTITASGPFDLSKQEGKLKIKVTGIGNQVLSLVGGRFGFGFGDTRLASDYDLELKDKAQYINITGSITGDKFSLKRENLTTPVVDVQVGFSFAVDRPKTNAVVRAFTINATQNGRPLLKGNLAKEMVLDWSGHSQAVNESSFDLAVTDLNLADWRALLGAHLTAGALNGKLVVNAQNAGRTIHFDLTSQLANLAGQFGGNRLEKAGVDFATRGDLAEFRSIKLADLTLQLRTAGQDVASIKGSGQIDALTGDADLQTEINARMDQVAALLGRPDLRLTAGAAKFTGHIQQKNLTPTQTNHPALDQNVSGKLEVTDLTGWYESNRLDRLGALANLDVGVKSDVAQIRQCAGFLTQASQPAGQFEVGGNYNLANKSGHVTFNLSNLNQAALGPLMASALNGKKLESVAVNFHLDAQMDSQGNSTVTGNFSATNLVVIDPTGTFPKTALAIGMQIDAGMAGKVLDCRQVKLSLAPTDRAKNELLLTGKINLANTNAITGGLKLAADSLDLTRYYDLFASTNTAAGRSAISGSAAAPPAGPAPAPEVEPPAKTFPLSQFVVEAQVGRLFVREVAATNLVAKMTINGGKIQMDPFTLQLNGAPVSAKLLLDLGMAGYQYDLDLKADNVPLAPLVDSFQPSSKGKIHGAATAAAAFKGAGITGPSLQKNLSGQFDFGSTNLDLALADVRIPVLKTIINVVVAIPDLIRNPGAGVTDLMGRFTGSSTNKGGWVDDVTRSPIEVVSAQGRIGAGRMDLQKAFVQSAAFQADAPGTVALAPVFTNSTLQIPVQIWLQRSLAGRVGLAGSTPANATYAQLPQFLTLTGTIGKPEKQINYRVLAETALKAGGGILGNAGGGALGTVEGLLGGHSKTNAPNQTNAPAKPLIPNPLDKFKLPF